MNNKFHRLAAGLLSVLGSGCALVPYESEFACSAGADYGRCTDVNGAYQQALTGKPMACSVKDAESGLCPMANVQADDEAVSFGAFLQSHDRTVSDDHHHHHFTSEGGHPRSPERSPATVVPQHAPTAESPRQRYQRNAYRAMADLVEQPQAPIVKPPTVLRTLVVGYQSNDSLFMPRYIYYFASGPEFVLSPPQSQLVPTPTLYPNGVSNAWPASP